MQTGATSPQLVGSRPMLPAMLSLVSLLLLLGWVVLIQGVTLTDLRQNFILGVEIKTSWEITSQAFSSMTVHYFLIW
jgi:hypothetical protein